MNFKNVCVQIIIGFTTGPPMPPTALTVNHMHSSPLSLLLLWNASHGENITYKLTATQVTDDNSNQKQFINVMSTSYIFNGERCMEYMFAVKALNPAGSSNNSNTVTATILG